MNVGAVATILEERLEAAPFLVAMVEEMVVMVEFVAHTILPLLSLGMLGLMVLVRVVEQVALVDKEMK
jgi:hypothetical protein